MTSDYPSDSSSEHEALLPLSQAAKRLNLTIVEVVGLIRACTLRTRIVDGEHYVFVPKSTSTPQALPESVLNRMRAARIAPEQLHPIIRSRDTLDVNGEGLLDSERAAGILTAVDAAVREQAAIEALKRRWRETERISLGPDLIQSLTDVPRGSSETLQISTDAFRIDGPIPSIVRRDMPTNIMLRWVLDVDELSRMLSPHKAKRSFVIEVHTVSDIEMHRTRGFVDASQEYGTLGSLLDRIDAAASHDSVTVMILCATAGWSTAARYMWTAESAPARERVIVVLQDLQDGTITTHPDEPRAATFHEWLSAPFRQERVRRLAHSFANAISGRIGVAEEEWPSLTNDATADRSMIEEAVALLVSTQKARLDLLAGVGRVLSEQRNTNAGSE